MTFVERVAAMRERYNTKAEAIAAANNCDSRAERCERLANDEEERCPAYGGLSSHYRKCAKEHKENAFAIRALLRVLTE